MIESRLKKSLLHLLIKACNQQASVMITSCSQSKQLNGVSRGTVSLPFTHYAPFPTLRSLPRFREDFTHPQQRRSVGVEETGHPPQDRDLLVVAPWLPRTCSQLLVQLLLGMGRYAAKPKPCLSWNTIHLDDLWSSLLLASHELFQHKRNH